MEKASHQPQAKPHPLVKAHAQALAQHLGRPAAEIAAQGLRATDFRDTLHFEWVDGSEATFHYAFFIHLPESKEIAVFTEHCGYFTFKQWVRITREGERVFDVLGE